MLAGSVTIHRSLEPSDLKFIWEVKEHNYQNSSNKIKQNLKSPRNHKNEVERQISGNFTRKL